MYQLSLIHICIDLGNGQVLPAVVHQLQGQRDGGVIPGHGDGGLVAVSYTHLGEKVMEKLKKADEVAYVRFASVYRQFKDINTFMSELNKLLSEK